MSFPKNTYENFSLEDLTSILSTNSYESHPLEWIDKNMLEMINAINK